MRTPPIQMSIGLWTVLLIGFPALADDPQVSIRFSESLIEDRYGYAYGLAAVDIDQDGNLDLTSADVRNETHSNLYWFRNNGQGTFERRTIHAGEPGWFERHAAGDINGDEGPDVAIVDNLDGRILWFANPLPRNKDKWQRYVVTTDLPRAYDVALADLDGDLDNDIAASGYDSGVFCWFENPGPEGWNSPWVRWEIDHHMSNARTIRAADFNRDGKIDLLGTASQLAPGDPQRGPLVWYQNPGDPRRQEWTRHVIDAESPAPIHGHPIDFDADGDLDVVMAFGLTRSYLSDLERHGVAWYEQRTDSAGNLAWVRHPIGKLPCAAEAHAADLDGDGDIDVAATAWEKGHGGVVWFENLGTPRTKWRRHILKEKWDSANQVIIADLNGDGRLDIAATADDGAKSNAITNELRWWRNEGSNTE